METRAGFIWFLKPDISSTDKLRVSLVGLPNGMMAESNGTLTISSGQSYTFFGGSTSRPS